MKLKNLDKAVLLTVMLMSFYGVAGAANIDSSIDSIENKTQNFENDKTYIINNDGKPYTKDVVTASNSNTATLHIGNNATDSVIIGAHHSNRTYFVSTGENSKIIVDGGILTFTKENAGGYTGSGLAMEVKEGGSIDLKNAATVIGTPTINSFDVFNGIKVLTYDTDESKASFNADGDLTLYAYNYNYHQKTEELLNQNIKAGVYIYSSDFTTKGNTFISAETRDNDGNYPGRTFGETAGVLIGHDRTAKKNNTKASNVTFGDDANDKTTIIGKYGEQVYGLRIDSNGANEADNVTFNGTADISASDGYGSTNGVIKCGVFALSNINGNLTFNNDVELLAKGTSGYPTPNVIGMELESGSNTVKGKIDISAQSLTNPNASGQNSVVNVAGIDAKNTTLDANSLDIYAQGSGNSGQLNLDAIKADDSKLGFKGAADIDIRAYGTKGKQSVNGIKADNKSEINFDDTVKISVKVVGVSEDIIATGIKADNSTLNFNKDVTIIADKAITAEQGAAVDIKSGFNGAASSKNVNTVMSADGAGTSIKINSGKSGVVTYTGTTSVSNSGTIEMNLTEENSVWNMTGNSKLTTLESHLNTVIDMTQDNGAFSTLTVETLTAGKDNDGGIIKMNIDGDAEKTADRLYITGEHTGNHYISIDDTVTDTAVGTVLVSVGTENGTFAAEKNEGALYWKDYDLEQVENAEAGGAYNTDWVIAAVKQDSSKGTTSVDTIVGANALNYHTWRAENDQLMQRMGELRNNGSDEQGAWFRMHGAEISHDDIAGFENKYTTYELGYDQITKQTENMTRYTGAALSYTDGSSSYNSGSGENHSKAISFYNTDIYSSGHYLDLVFKFANMDNDFSVYDTKGQNITGEYKNNGISLSAEYGRKNEMANGWYIEPQAQLTLGYFGGDEYETSNGIKVNQGGIASVLGRAGFNIGKELGGNGVIYAKASLLHEFAGDYDIRMTDSTGISRNESASFNDTWFEYGVGAALKTGKNNHLYFDFVKTAGGSFEKDWQWNAGMRWTF